MTTNPNKTRTATNLSPSESQIIYATASRNGDVEVNPTAREPRGGHDIGGNIVRETVSVSAAE